MSDPCSGHAHFLLKLTFSPKIDLINEAILVKMGNLEGEASAPLPPPPPLPPDLLFLPPMHFMSVKDTL